MDNIMVAVSNRHEKVVRSPSSRPYAPPSQQATTQGAP